MKVTVYKSKFSDKLFHLDKKDEFVEHLISIREKLRTKRKYARAVRTFEDWLSKEKENISSIKELETWFIKNFSEIIIFYNSLSMEREVPEDANIINFSLIGNFRKSVSNSHSAPKGYKTNWGGYETKNGVPRGYPGFYGHVRGGVDKNLPGFSITNLLQFIGIQTGSGGGSDSNFHYESTVWLYDWPRMGESVLFEELTRK